MYVYARRSGVGQQDAEDLTQGFFLHIVSKDFFKQSQQGRGRMRSLLLKSFKNHIVNKHRSASRLKRGGDVQLIPIDAEDAEARMNVEPRHDLTAEREFDLCWAREILNQAKARLRDSYEEAGKLDHFLAFEDQLEDGKSERSYREIAGDLDVPEARVRFIAFKLRQRYGALLEEIVADTVVTQEEASEEMAHLKSVFSH